MNMQKTIILVENNKVISKDIKFILEDNLKTDVVANITTNDDLEEYYLTKNPDLTLISMEPDNDAEINFAQKFIHSHPDALVIAISSTGEHVYHKFVKKIGFFGFINKNNFLKDYKSTMSILSN